MSTQKDKHIERMTKMVQEINEVIKKHGPIGNYYFATLVEGKLGSLTILNINHQPEAVSLIIENSRRLTLNHHSNYPILVIDLQDVTPKKDR